MINTLLQQAKMENHVISIYTDKEHTDKFSTGFIQQISEQHVLIAHISPFGQYDGYLIKNYSDIYRLEYQGQYEKKIERLYCLQAQSHLEVTNTSDSLIENLLSFSYVNKLVISLEIEYSGYDDVQGIINKIQDDFIVIEQLDDNGEPDGEVVVFKSDITSLTSDSDKEFSLRLLREDKIKRF